VGISVEVAVGVAVDVAVAVGNSAARTVRGVSLHSNRARIMMVSNTPATTQVPDNKRRASTSGRGTKGRGTGARVVVTGCYAQVDPQALAVLPGVALVIGNEEKQDFLSRMTSLDCEIPQIAVTDIRQVDTAETLPLSSFEQRSRAFVQVQNGCDAFCSYCIIPYARGRSRSVAAADVVQQVEYLSAAGYPEVVLTGIHIGNYGQDLQPSIDLLALLKEIERSDFSGRLRLGSIEPTELPAELLDYVAAAEWICPHYHIPLQAGDDEILQRMNRHYTTGFFRDLLVEIRNRQQQTAIGLDIITGFPGETEQQFTATCNLLQDLPFSHLHVFPFSRRPGTPAAEMKEQLPGNFIKERAARLREIGKQKLAEYAQQFVGQTLDVVVEGGEVDGKKKGLSDNYLSVWLPSAGLVQGQCLQVKIEARQEGDLSGEIALKS
jgi:threonylcarbamoyladenosine tRNA methylthiotransferase MtaB